MRGKMLSLGLLSSLLFFVGCSGQSIARTPVRPPFGFLFTQYSAPLSTENSATPTTGKVGRASTYYIHDPIFTGMSFAWDSADVKKAAENGRISTVFYADYTTLNVLGVFGQFTVTVYGE